MSDLPPPVQTTTSLTPQLIPALPLIPTRGQLSILFLILAVAAAIRIVDLGGHSVVMDEIWSIELSMGRGSVQDHLPLASIKTESLNPSDLGQALPWWNVWTHMAGVAHPPLYHIVLRWWMDCFGTSPAGARSLSVMMSLIAIAALFDVCRLLHGTRIALWAAAIMALAGAQVDYAQLARSYAMLLMLGLGCADAIVRIEKFGATRRRLAAVTGLLTAMALTHYFIVGAAGAMGVYAVMRLRGGDRKKTIAAFAMAGILAAILWGPWFIAQQKSLPAVAPDFLVDHGAGHVGATVWRIVSLPIQFLLSDRVMKEAGRGTIAVVAVLALGIPILRLRQRGDLLLWVLWACATMGLIAAVDLKHGWHSADFVRYSILASPGIYALIAATNWPGKSVFRDMVPAAILIVMAVSMERRLIRGVEPAQHIDEYANLLDASAKPDELLVFYGNDPWNMPGFAYTAFKYYRSDSARPWLILDRPAGAEILRELGGRDGLWLIGPHPDEDGPSVLPGWKPEYRVPARAANIWHMVRGFEGLYHR